MEGGVLIFTTMGAVKKRSQSKQETNGTKVTPEFLDPEIKAFLEPYCP